MDYQMDINEKFEKLERKKYGRESINEHNRLLDFYKNCKWEEDREDLYNLYEYITEHDND